MIVCKSWLCAIAVLFFSGASASAAASAAVSSDVANSGAAVNALGLTKSAAPLLAGAAARFGCPLCDSSVYSYCSNRAVHDGCCCNGGRPPIGYGYGCPPSNCNYLHANSCYEHNLILTCCCNRP